MMKQMTKQDVKVVCKKIEALAKKEAEKYEFKEYDFKKIVRDSTCSAILGLIDTKFEGAPYTEEGVTSFETLCGSRLVLELKWQQYNGSVFDEEGIHAQFILQNMDKVEEFIAGINYNKVKVKKYLSGDYSLMNVVFEVLAREIDSYGFIYLNQYDRLHNNRTLSTGGACEMLDKLGFTDEEYKSCHLIWLDIYGYDKNGFAGGGYNREGFDEDGYDIEGYDIEGYNRDGFDEYGYDKYGYDENGFDEDGNEREH